MWRSIELREIRVFLVLAEELQEIARMKSGVSRAPGC